MAPQSQRVKEQRRLARLAAFLNDTQNLDPNAKEITAAELAALSLTSAELDDAAIEAEAMLLYFDLNGKGFTKQECPECKRIFAYKYTILGVKKVTKKDETVVTRPYTGTFRCSNECRAASLAKIGIKWNPYKYPEDRWGVEGRLKGTIPLIVPPAELEILESKIQEKNGNNTDPVA